MRGIFSAFKDWLICLSRKSQCDRRTETMNSVDLIGQPFDRLLVIEYSGQDKHGNHLYKCRCIDGNIVTVQRSALICGRTRSCGCLHKEAAARCNHKHGMAHTRAYKIWENMMQRCYNPKTMPSGILPRTFFHGFARSFLMATCRPN